MAGIADITGKADQVLEGTTQESLFVIHTDTNDVCETRSEKLLDKYRRLTQQYKNKSNNIMISGMFPRIALAYLFYSKAFSQNNCLNAFCREHGD